MSGKIDSQCIFCQIISGSANAAVIYQDEVVTAFLDAHPIAPTHILVVPNQHIGSLNEIQPEHEAMLGRLVAVAHQLASQSHLSNSGYRLVINTGPDAAQSIFHLHLHLIGGRKMPFHFRE